MNSPFGEPHTPPPGAPPPPPAAPPFPPPPAPRKRARWPWFLVGGLVLVCLCSGGTVVACTTFLGKEASKEHTVLYELTGTGTADVTYSTDGGAGTAQENDVALPWRKELTTTGLFSTYSLLGQRIAEDSGSITCRIVVDGKEIKTVTSAGAFVIAACTATSADVD